MASKGKLSAFPGKYSESEDTSKFVVSSASLHIHNVLTKGVQHKSMSKSILKGDGCTSWPINSIASY